MKKKQLYFVFTFASGRVVLNVFEAAMAIYYIYKTRALEKIGDYQFSLSISQHARPDPPEVFQTESDNELRDILTGKYVLEDISAELSKRFNKPEKK